METVVILLLLVFLVKAIKKMTTMKIVNHPAAISF